MNQEQPINDAVEQINTAVQNLTLALGNIDEVQNNNDSTDQQRFRFKRNAVKAIDRLYLLKIPGKKLTVEFYKALEKKLGIEDDAKNFRLNFFVPEFEHKSPRDLVIYLVANGDANHKTVRKLFETQFEIKWQTECGDPDLFSFYGFCKDVMDRTRARGRGPGRGRGRTPGRGPVNEVMTYKTRRAHVLSRLYHAQDELHKIRDLTYEKLCPPVYARKGDGNWVKFTFMERNARKEITLCREEDNINIEWISNNDLKGYIQSKSVKEDKNFPYGIGQLYWAVFEEDDFEDRDTHVKDFGRTQVYVGKAINGITERWMGGGTSHCKRMGVVRDVMCNMLSYDPTALQSEQLVDLRLLLHKAWNQDGGNSGLFIMGEFTKRVEENGEIKILGDASKLNKAEKDNINGKKASDSKESIISLRQNENWNPKDMIYGMNGKC